MLFLVLDWFFIVLHSVLIIFNLFGWIWKATRRLNLATLLLTGLSWIGLGLYYGIGYCPLTDWHWMVLSKIGNTPHTPSYIAYLIHRMLGITISTSTADWLTLGLFLCALFLSIKFNLKRQKKKID